MRKCHYVYEDGGKYLIPGCWSVVHYFSDKNAMRHCTCRDNPDNFRAFERKEFNEAIKELKKDVSDLEKENAQLYRTIQKLTKNGYTR